MKIFNFIRVLLTLIFLFSFSLLHSQMKFGAGSLSCNIDGDTITFALNTDLNNLYYMANGGTADFGLIKLQWNEVKTPADIKVQTLELDKGFVEKDKISIIWADFYTNLPYIIQKGKLSVTENSGSIIKGTLEITAELGGSSIIGDLLKGKKETVLKDGYFVINY